MKKSFQSYVIESNKVIGGYKGPPKEEKPASVKAKPNLEVIQIEESIDEVDEYDEYVDDTITEDVETEEEIITEQVDLDVVALNESIIQLSSFLYEQQENQKLLGNLISGLVETVRQQNTYIQEKFDHLDEALFSTSNVLQETALKLEQLAIREVNIQPPIVNVSLSEQKRIVKTVNRDANGLISQITEEIQQSVSDDK
jgi:hypothetical protein